MTGQAGNVRRIDTRGRLTGDITTGAQLASRDGTSTMTLHPVSRIGEAFPKSDPFGDQVSTAHLKDVRIRDGAAYYPVVVEAEGSKGFLPGFFNAQTRELTVEIFPHEDPFFAAERAAHLTEDHLWPKPDLALFLDGAAI